MRKLILLGVLTTVLLGASATGASATTFSGTCHVEGKLTMVDSPLTLRIEHHDYVARGAGTCEGTLDGAPYNGPVDYFMDGRMNTPMSCAVGTSNDHPATLTFGDDPQAVDAPRLVFLSSHVSIATEGPVAPLTGAYNGLAWGRYHFTATDSTVEECAGSGVTEVDAMLDIRTITPLYG